MGIILQGRIIIWECYNKIKSIKGSEWTEAFAEEVYNNVKKRKYFITNLGKCTQGCKRIIR